MVCLWTGLFQGSSATHSPYRNREIFQIIMRTQQTDDDDETTFKHRQGTLNFVELPKTLRHEIPHVEKAPQVNFQQNRFFSAKGWYLHIFLYCVFSLLISQSSWISVCYHCLAWVLLGSWKRVSSCFCSIKKLTAATPCVHLPFWPSTLF